MFKSVLAAAIVSALVAGGSTAAASHWISGRSIKPHSIPLNRLVHIPTGPAGPAGPAGPQGPQGDDRVAGYAYLCVAPDNSITFLATAVPVCNGHVLKVATVN